MYAQEFEDLDVNEVPSLKALRRGIERVVDQYYYLLSRNLPETKAHELLQQYKMAADIEKDIEELERKENGEEVEMMGVLADTKVNI